MTGLRFAFLTTFYPPFNFGGDGIGIQRLARGLARAGHHVTVVHDRDAYAALAARPLPAPQDEIDGIEVITLQSGVGILSPLLTQQTGRPVMNGRKIRRILDDGKFDVINFHNLSLIGGPGLLSYGRGIKLFMAHEHWLVCPTHVLWRHNRELCDERQCIRCQLRYLRPPQWWRMTGLLERELRHVDSFIAMSEFSRDKHREFGFPREMEVLPYFLPVENATGRPAADESPAPNPRPYFLFVGRLEKIKGVQDVIPAFAGEGDADLVIAGDGEYASTLRDQAHGMPRVRFLGRVPSDELSAWYRHAVALVVPSLCYETFGIILLEAFRQSTPVIARRVGPLPELVRQSGGGEVFSDAGELEAAMARLLQDPGHRAALAKSGCEAFIRNWSEQAVVPLYLDIVRRAAIARNDTRVIDTLS